MCFFAVVPLKQVEGFGNPEKEPLSDDDEVAVVGAKDKYQLVYIIFLLHGDSLFWRDTQRFWF